MASARGGGEARRVAGKDPPGEPCTSLRGRRTGRAVSGTPGAVGWLEVGRSSARRDNEAERVAGASRTATPGPGAWPGVGMASARGGDEAGRVAGIEPPGLILMGSQGNGGISSKETLVLVNIWTGRAMSGTPGAAGWPGVGRFSARRALEAERVAGASRSATPGPGAWPGVGMASARVGDEAGRVAGIDPPGLVWMESQGDGGGCSKEALVLVNIWTGRAVSRTPGAAGWPGVGRFSA